MRTNDLIKYIVENYPHPDELSKARLNKIIYLIDWKSAIDKEEQITDINWYFNHYGPYVKEIEELILDDNRFFLQPTITIYGNEKTIITLVDDTGFNSPTVDEKTIIDFVIEKTRRFYWKRFIELVYSTYPIISQEKGSNLDLVSLAKAYNRMKEETD